MHRGVKLLSHINMFVAFAFPKIRKGIIQHNSIMSNLSLDVLCEISDLHVMRKLYFMVKKITLLIVRANKIKNMKPNSPC